MSKNKMDEVKNMKGSKTSNINNDNNNSNSSDFDLKNQSGILQENGHKDKTKENSRVWEIDFLRGIALLLMIYFHLIFDLKEIYNFNVDYTTGFNAFTGRAAGTLFVLLAGVSCTFSRNNLKRGLKILALAILITLVTYFYNPDMIILFGVLHFLGISILLYSFLRKLDVISLAILGTVIFILGNPVKNITLDYDYLFIFGLTSDKFVSADYYPLIPWLGIFIYGIVIGKLLYKEKKSIFSFNVKFNVERNIISWLGRHTLPIYMLHQPLLILLIGLFKKIVV